MFTEKTELYTINNITMEIAEKLDIIDFVKENKLYGIQAKNELLKFGILDKDLCDMINHETSCKEVCELIVDVL